MCSLNCTYSLSRTGPRFCGLHNPEMGINAVIFDGEQDSERFIVQIGCCIAPGKYRPFSHQHDHESHKSWASKMPNNYFDLPIRLIQSTISSIKAIFTSYSKLRTSPLGNIWLINGEHAVPQTKRLHEGQRSQSGRWWSRLCWIFIPFILLWIPPLFLKNIQGCHSTWSAAL